MRRNKTFAAETLMKQAQGFTLKLRQTFIRPQASAIGQWFQAAQTGRFPGTGMAPRLRVTILACRTYSSRPNGDGGIILKFEGRILVCSQQSTN